MGNKCIPVLALVVPCYNEEEVLPSSALQLCALMQRLRDNGIIDSESFILFVDDGSRDSTWKIIEELHATVPGCEGLKMAGNFGQQNVMLAGMEVAIERCDAVITIDADLQDDIEVIPQMVRQYGEGSDIVYGVRDNRDADTWMKRNTAKAFYKFMTNLGVKTIYNHSEFRLMSARAVEALLEYEERNIYIRGILPIMGFEQSTVSYARKKRSAGETKYSVLKLMNLALVAITSFSTKPIRFLFTVSLLFLLVALGMLTFVLVRYFTGNSIEGWASIILSIWFCSGILLMSMAIMGEYIGNIYTEVKHRPRFIKERRAGEK